MILLLFVFLTTCATGGEPQTHIPVRIEAVGDDGLTNRFQDALEAAFKASPDFTVVTMPTENDLLVSIPTNLDWSAAGPRVRAHYKVKFSAKRSLRLRSSEGACWEDEVENCARHVVADAKAAVSR